jgi:hypothetical protein
MSEIINGRVEEAFLSLTSKKYPFCSATKSFATPRGHSLTVRFSPCNRSAERLPTSPSTCVFEPSEKVNVTEDKKICSGFADTEALTYDAGKEEFCGVGRVVIVMVVYGPTSKSSRVNPNSIRRISKNCVDKRGFEFWHNIKE